jgi:hypothetical protein
MDLFVAGGSVVEKPGGELVSHCVRGEGLDALLPVTHKVAFMPEGGSRAAALGSF